ncbi:MAG: ATP-binding protein [Oscillatoriales cyanobacterium SM2_2_1]|nr:ATP-binding protein [Oscillatoriales cyanobacterium SM2_2_1]
MKLHRLQYVQDRGLASSWELEGCDLDTVNLIVGRNASGKSRILQTMDVLARLLSGTAPIPNTPKQQCWQSTFDADGDAPKCYTLETSRGQVIREHYQVGDRTLLERQETGAGTIWAEDLKTLIRFHTPTDRVAALLRRDRIQHPFVEELHDWAQALMYFRFGTSLGQQSYAVMQTRKLQTYRDNINLRDSDQVIAIFRLGEEDYQETFIDRVIADMGQIGYPLNRIGIKKPSFLLAEGQDDTSTHILDGEPQYLYVQEADLASYTEQYMMSQGMFRALSLIIQINYSLLARTPSCILIDDVGEGLDHERSSALIKLLIAKVEASPVQLIMTTNDRFVMNGVPLHYWLAIERQVGVAKLHNRHNSQAAFEEFCFTGLNNFDFFARGYYLHQPEEEEDLVSTMV